MDKIINKNDLFFVKEYKFDKKIFMKEIIYSMMLLKIVETISIHLIISLFMILTL